MLLSKHENLGPINATNLEQSYKLSTQLATYSFISELNITLGISSFW